MQRIDSTGLPVNVILVSDHGMSELVEKEETYIFIDEYVQSNGSIQVANGGTQAHIYTATDAQTDSLFNILNANAKDFTVIKRKDFPQRWHYDHERSGNLMMLVKPGKYIISGDRTKFKSRIRNGSKFGAHGFDPDEVPEMAGIFYAKGPNIKKGIKLPAFRNIHVYPLIAEILKMKTPPIDGDFKVLKPVYKKP
jgi:alkaline phosphatase D